MNVFTIFEAAGKISSSVHEADRKRREAYNNRPRCGYCVHWITDKCPQEENVNGLKRGPSMNSDPCNLFSDRRK